MRVGIARSRWALLVHCVHSVGKIFWQSGRVGSLESQLSKKGKALLSPWTGCDRKERDVVRELEGGALTPSILSFECEALPAGWGFRRGGVLLS